MNAEHIRTFNVLSFFLSLLTTTVYSCSTCSILLNTYYHKTIRYYCYCVVAVVANVSRINAAPELARHAPKTSTVIDAPFGRERQNTQLEVSEGVLSPVGNGPIM
jgi:hypothetical protein